ncbi:hypothetical protein Gotri_005221 [Gossypium trilobum]|uniref:Uncharacterized protein n=1 Tax=Gossypium trilobum TaxID=34281 RepID=A0A7J9EVU0_9ROSI|nr:hypothetical protein [Gossypium trilobum]MBA0777163.1 hypothetical protein [Gossypium trilobum]MBA0777166.1 hypothetical protein [Gossypium trilobum]
MPISESKRTLHIGLQQSWIQRKG